MSNFGLNKVEEEESDDLYERKLQNEIINELINLDKSVVGQPKEKKKFINQPDYYRNLIFNGTIEDVKKMKIKLELVNSKMKEKMDLWNFFRYNVSSLKMGKSVGIQVYFLVKDETSQKYLGIISLGSDFNNLGDRDKYIGWDLQTKNKNLKYVLNIKTCVPLQPFGFNFIGGKLLAMLCFSKEVSEMFIERMKNRKINPLEYPILAITTTSLYGRGAQYNKLKCLKYIGKTKGESAVHIPDSTFQKCKELCKIKNIKLGNGSHARGKTTIIKKLLPKINLPRSIVYQNYQRGIFMGYLYPNSNELLVNPNVSDESIMQQLNLGSLETIDEIFNKWLNKYAIKRFESVVSKKRIKNKINLFLTPNEKKRQYVSEYRKTKIEDIGINKVREMDRNRVKNSKSAYKKKSFTDKYDIDKLKNINFTTNAKHLEKYKEKIITIVNDDPFINNKEMASKIGISIQNIRSILNKCKV